jgi:RNA polymerase sigma factor (sigma-70 family)
MPDMPAVVYLVDDEKSVLRALTRLLFRMGFDAQPFSSPRDFLMAHDPGRPGCAIVDLQMPEIDGLALQRELTSCARPVIFLSGRSDVSSSVRAMKAGAVDFLVKPVGREDLSNAVDRALQRDREIRSAWSERQALGQRLDKLTPRERQVFELVVTGRMNKQVAGELGTAEKTVKVHRARVMEKLQARSVVDLVRIADRASAWLNSSRV